MPDIYTLSIDTPCTENWDAMLPDAKGKFCLSCQKSVIDFSVMSDAEIVSILEQTSGAICGRMSAAQQNREIVREAAVPGKRKSLTRPLEYLAGLLLSLWGQSAIAQNKPIVPAAVVEQRQSAFEGITNDTAFLKGVVLDSNKEGIPGAIIHIKGRGVSTVSDEAGQFSLEIPDSLKLSSFTIIISGLGLRESMNEIYPEMLHKKNTFLMDETTLGTEVWVGMVAVKAKKRHWWQFWKPKYYR